MLRADPRFNPKEDVSSSTSLKSSVQRNIRGQLLEQMPLLTKPAYREGGAEKKEEAAPAPAAEAAPAAEPEEEKGGKGGKKGGKGKGGGKKGKKADKEPEAEEADEGEVLVIDEIWPKKEALGLTKW